MAVVKRKTQQSVVVAGTGGAEQLLKVTVTNVDGELVTLKIDVPAGAMVYPLEEWEQVQAAKAKTGDRPKQNAAYTE